MFTRSSSTYSTSVYNYRSSHSSSDGMCYPVRGLLSDGHLQAIQLVPKQEANVAINLLALSILWNGDNGTGVARRTNG